MNSTIGFIRNHHKMSVLNFIEELSDHSNWVIHHDSDKGGRLAIGKCPSVHSTFQCDRVDTLIKAGVNVWVSLMDDPDQGNRVAYISKHAPLSKFLSFQIPQSNYPTKPIYKIIEFIFQLVKRGKFVFVYCQDGYTHSQIISTCFLIRYYGYDVETAMNKNRLMYLSRVSHPCKPLSKLSYEYSIIHNYRPPMTVVISGDRNSSFHFRTLILRALKDLPPQSTIVHGACRGIDTTAGEIAKDLGLRVIEYPVTKKHWDYYGKAAGVIRNKAMLETKPDMVLAFHPEIENSKGTKNMMIEAFKIGIPVYLYDLKSKIRFDGKMK